MKNYATHLAQRVPWNVSSLKEIAPTLLPFCGYKYINDQAVSLLHCTVSAGHEDDSRGGDFSPNGVKRKENAASQRLLINLRAGQVLFTVGRLHAEQYLPGLPGES